MNTLKYLLGQLGQFLRIFLRLKLPKKLYRSMGFSGPFSIFLNNQKIRLNNFRDEISNHIFYSGIFGNYEGYSLKIWNQLSIQTEKSYVLDIGGYSGIFSLVSASANSEISIHSFEPHPDTFKRLKKNISSNIYTNISTHNFALDIKNGDFKFYNSKGTSPSGFSLVNHSHIEKDAGTKICKTKKIDELLEERYKDMRISLIKIDVERAEYPILQSIISRIIQDKSCVLCEILDEEFYEKFDQLFCTNHFQSIVIDDDKHSAFQVKKLAGMSKVGRNILFIPKDFNFKDIQESL